MQGIIVVPNGDVWVLGATKNQLLYFPKGDWDNGRIVLPRARYRTVQVDGGTV